MCTSIVSNRKNTIVGWNLDILDMEHQVVAEADKVYIAINDKTEGWMPLFGANARGDFVAISTRFMGIFERDELNSIACEGFLIAYQTWNKAYWKFDDYAEFVITDTLLKAKNANSFHQSLDKMLPDGKGCLKDLLHAGQEPYVNRVYGFLINWL